MPIVTTIGPTQSDAQAALRAWLLDSFPAVSVVAAQANRIAEPTATTFIVMTPILYRRNDTNLDTYADAVFTGSVAGSLMTVSAMRAGSHSILPNSFLFGVNVPTGVVITSQASGTPGGTGTYNLSQSFSQSSETLASGSQNLQLNAELTIQLDFHSADTSAAEMAETTSTLFRDDVACTYFAALPSPQNRIFPLYADNPAQRPFINDQQQYEWRWVLDVCMQVNQIVAIPRQFADTVSITRIAVDEFYVP
jgi:hypothetical protein